MRTWRAVTYVSLAVLSLGLFVILSTPLRFPGYIILPFGPVLTFLIPAFATVALLAARLLLPHHPFSILLIVAGTGFTVLWLLGSLAAVVLLGSLIVLALMYFASMSIQPPDDEPAALQSP